MRESERSHSSTLFEFDGISANTLYALPQELFTNVLSNFCDGKTISTFLLASQASCEFDGFETVQGALVQRYQQLSLSVQDDNIAETLDILLDQIQTCERSAPECMKLFSELCAILDYFEAHGNDNHWLIWTGEVETFYGTIKTYMTSPYWSISAIASWYRDLELTHFSLVRPRFSIERPTSYPFGALAGRSRRDSVIMDRLRSKLQVDYGHPEEYWRGMLTALQFAYACNPPLILTTHAFPLIESHQDLHVPGWLSPLSSLTCYWDDYGGYDEEALLHLGEHIIRLMEQFTSHPSSRLTAPTDLNFRHAWRNAVDDGLAQPEEYFQGDDSDDDEESEDDTDEME